jgi:hypothetical protein
MGLLHLVDDLDYSGKPSGWRHEFFLLQEPPTQRCQKQCQK